MIFIVFCIVFAYRAFAQVWIGIHISRDYMYKDSHKNSDKCDSKIIFLVSASLIAGP